MHVKTIEYLRNSTNKSRTSLKKNKFQKKVFEGHTFSKLLNFANKEIETI